MKNEKWRHDLSPYSFPGAFRQTRYLIAQYFASNADKLDIPHGLFQDVLQTARALTRKDKAFQREYDKYQPKPNETRVLSPAEKWDIIGLVEEAFSRANAWTYPDLPEGVVPYEESEDEPVPTVRPEAKVEGRKRP